MKVLRLVAGVQNLKQLLDTCLNSRQEKLDVLVGLVIRLAKREDTEGGHKLLRDVRLQVLCCVDRLAPEGILLDFRMYPLENDAGHSKAALKCCLVIYGLAVVQPEEICHDAAQADLKVSIFVGAAAGHRADVRTEPVDTADAQAQCRPGGHRLCGQYGGRGHARRSVAISSGLRVRRLVG